MITSVDMYVAIAILYFYAVIDSSISHRLRLKEVAYSVVIPAILYVILMYYSLHSIYITVSSPEGAALMYFHPYSATIMILSLLWMAVTAILTHQSALSRFYKEYDLPKSEIRRRLHNLGLWNYKRKSDDLKPHLRS